MITLKNPLAVSEWIINLKEYPQVENALPLTGLNVRNDSNIVAYVDLDGLKVGEVQRYGADAFQGRAFSLIRVYNPDGQEFAPNDLFIQATKGEVMGSQPFNPQWDMMFFDLDRFAAGTDSRTSLSGVITADLIKFWLNSQNTLIVQRKIDIQAHATLLGEYTITFSPTDVLSGAAGIGIPPPPDTVQYRKSITNGEFDYSLTNTTLIGWVIDYLSNIKDISNLFTLITGVNGEKFYSNLLSEYMDEWVSSASRWITMFEVEFSSQTIDEIHWRFKYKTSNGAGSIYCRLDYYNGSWVTLKSYDGYTGTSYDLHFDHHTGLNLSGVTKIRIQVGGGGAAVTRYVYLYKLLVLSL